VAQDDTADARPVILFDGVCHLCHGLVQFVLERDPAGQFDFAPLQGEFARARLGAVDWNSIVLIEGDAVFYAEAAVLRILGRLGGPWPWLARIVGWLPRALLAWAYRLVARYRYRVFGRDEVCRLPRADWKDRFLT
jgi:predicted DCC family thiol-disulfide oxidoreductase YuxK